MILPLAEISQMPSKFLEFRPSSRGPRPGGSIAPGKARIETYSNRRSPAQVTKRGALAAPVLHGHHALAVPIRAYRDRPHALIDNLTLVDPYLADVVVNRKIRPSVGCGENSVLSTVVRGYDLCKPGGHLGIVGSTLVGAYRHRRLEH